MAFDLFTVVDEVAADAEFEAHANNRRVRVIATERCMILGVVMSRIVPQQDRRPRSARFSAREIESRGATNCAVIVESSQR